MRTGPRCAASRRAANFCLASVAEISVIYPRYGKSDQNRQNAYFDHFVQFDHLGRAGRERLSGEQGTLTSPRTTPTVCESIQQYTGGRTFPAWTLAVQSHLDKL